MAVFSSIIKLGFSNGLVTVCLFFLLLLTLAILVHRRFYKYSRRFTELADKIPGPKWYPFIGSAYVFGTDAKDILQSTTDCCIKYDAVSKYWIGPGLYVCLQNVKDIEVILSNNRLLTKPSAYEHMKPGTGDGILVSSGEKWKKHRKALKPTFTYPVYESYIDVFNAKIKILTDILEQQVDKQHFNLSPFIHNLVYDILWETIMTTNSNSMMIRKEKQDRFADAVNETVSIILCRMFKPWLFMDSVFNTTAYGRLANSHMEYVHGKIKEVIYGKRRQVKDDNSERKQPEGKNDKPKIAFLDYTLEHSLRNGLNDEDIFNETCTILFAGFDSTSSTLAHICFVLSRRFDVQEKIVEEIEDVFGSLEERPFTYEDLQRMEYVERVVKECLRLFSTIPFIARQVTEEIDLPSGYTLPNGCAVVIPFFRLHRNPSLYPNPHVFDPDNFLPERVASRPSYSFCPFSAGPRDCIGKKFAMLQLKAGVMSIVRRFWITPTDQTLELAAKMNLNPVNGVNIGLKKRTVNRPVVEGMETMSKCLFVNVDFLNVMFKESYL